MLLHTWFAMKHEEAKELLFKEDRSVNRTTYQKLN